MLTITTTTIHPDLCGSVEGEGSEENGSVGLNHTMIKSVQVQRTKEKKEIYTVSTFFM